MKITRRFTKPGQDAFSGLQYETRTSRITNPDGSVVFEMTDAQIPASWSQLATDIMVSKYFRKAGVPQTDAAGNVLRDASGKVVTGPEKSAKQVVHRLAGCWRDWAEKHGYFDSPEDAQAFYDELAHMMLAQMCAPNSPQWFNTGLNFAYGITGPAQGHFYCDPHTGELRKSADAYTHPQPHACQPFYAPVSTPKGIVRIGKIVKENLVGLEVFDGTQGGAGTTRVVAVKHNGQKVVHRVQLSSGTAVYATADHFVFAIPAGSDVPTWRELGLLEPGDKLIERLAVKEPLAGAATAPDALLAKHGSAKTAAAAATRPDALVFNRAVDVTAVSVVGTEDVYDIQTESGQYLSNNVIVHNCFIQSVSDDLVNAGGIMDLWTREARLFKYGSGTGSNFSNVRGENEKLSGGGKSSGLMSFLKIGDRAAGAIKSGGTTRRAAKMVCLDLDHPDIEQFVNWKVREEIKVAALAEGIKVLAKDQQELARKLKLKLDYDFNGEAYFTVSGQNSNNSVRIPNAFFKAVESDGDWALTWRINGKVAKSLKARDLWEQIAFAAWRCADPGVQYDDTINQWHTCPQSGRINASNPCVTGDTRVLTPGGIWRRIDQMIHLPSRVVTNLDGQAIHSVEGAFPTGHKEVFELRTAGGYSLKLTADHKVWTRGRGWVAAAELNTADEIRLPSQPATVQTIGEPQDPRFFQLLGLFLSGANGSAHALRLEAALAGTHLHETFARYVAEHWADAGNGGNGSSDNESTYDREPASAVATLTNRRLMNRMRAYLRIEAGGHVRLSDEAFTSGLAAQKHLLRALFTADAFVTNGSLELYAVGRGLLEDVQLILLGFGVQSAILDFDDEDGDDADSAPADAALRHGLRIDSGSLRMFGKHVGLLPGAKLEQLAGAVSYAIARGEHCGNFDRVASFTPVGRQQVFDLTEPVTESFVANGLTVHNCSEYMFLDDTACNLASLNVLTFFDAKTQTFDVEAYRHAIRIWTIVLETSVLMASFPSEEIATLSYKFRTLGLGYANLGAMLMQAGIPYDSDKGRAVCAALTAILTGESYATSAEMAAQLGAFPGYAENKADMLRVMRNHRRAAYGVGDHGLTPAPTAAATSLGAYEALDILPVPIDAGQFSPHDTLASDALLKTARECWDRAVAMGERHGYRNAQTTVIAPTGTIGLLMDCDTTGVEPDFALVKFKKLAGGGYFKIANQSLPPALLNLGYTKDQVGEILRYVMGSLTLHDAPGVSYAALREKGFTAGELDKIESTLGAQFELAFAFSPWSVGEKTLERLGIAPAVWQAPGFNLLRHLGFTKKQIEAANDVVCGRATVEGAPHLKPEHYPVFDCANKCGRHGTRFIPADGHIRMMAAAQPFISGAISKTINLPNEATVEEIKRAYELSWKLGLKANALYRDGSKLSQPLNVKSDDEAEQATDADDEENVNAAKEELANDAAHAVAVISSSPETRTPEPGTRVLAGDNFSPAPAPSHVIEKIVERIVERPLRRRLPDTRQATTHKFDVAGHEGYITVGLYEDGSPGEIFIRMAKEGSTIGGLMDTVATLVSVSLQYGVPIESLVRKFEHVRFEPSGMTHNKDIPFAKSLVDYIFRWLAMEFIPGYRAANAPQRAKKMSPDPEGERPTLTKTATTHLPAPKPTSNGNGHAHPPRLAPDPAKPLAVSDAVLKAAHSPHLQAPGVGTPTPSAPALRLAIATDPLSQQGSEMQSDAPACDVCGSITVRSGTCYKCLNCGNSMGCS